MTSILSIARNGLPAGESGDDLSELTSEQQWQPILWRALVERTQELGQSHWHRANMHTEFAKALEQGTFQGTFQGTLPKRLFVFGISALPPGYVEALHALGQRCDVHLMVTNPCRYYWGDIRDARYLAKLRARIFRDGTVNPDLFQDNDTGNPLLASTGKLGRDYLYLLQELTSGENASEQNAVSEIDAFVDINQDSLLHRIQHDILELQDSTQSGQVVARNDQSLSFHGCHSPLREVEVLHDYLLELFNSDKALTPRDIIVMVPDIDSYAPFLQAVFGSATGERFIPFALSDRSASQEHPALAAFHRLLTLDQNRASVPELIELLEVRALQSCYGLDADNLSTLVNWIEDAGVRWGLNQEHQGHFDIPQRQENTWLFGLRRMLLGYAMPAEMGLYDDVLPCDLVQGMDAELAGKLADFIESCEWLLQELDTPRDADQWTLFLNQLLDRFFLPDEDDEQVLQNIRQALDKFRQQLCDASFTEKLPRAVMTDWLLEHLGSTRNSQRFLAGQVNICTLMPMRSIPFKVVCLLGMNDSAYPRSLPPMGFDLMAKDPRRGDRSRREDDRYLFLEALLSAQDKLYISYVSRNIRDDSERFPSVLVTELQNLIQESFVCEDGQETLDGEQLVHNLFHQHSLQPFSQKNFLQDTRQSYAREWLQAASGSGEELPAFYNEPLSDFIDRDSTPDLELPLKQLLTFWSNPCQAFCQQRLKVFFDDDDEATETREPFSLSGLTGWQLKDSLTRQYLKDADTQHFRQRARAAGTLPHGSFGELAIDEIYGEASELASIVSPWIKKPVDEDIEVNLPLNDSRLTGWLNSIYKQSDGQHVQVFWRTGTLHAKHRFQMWVQHLCYCACAPEPGQTVCLTSKEQFLFRPLSPENATSLLANMERLLWQGLARPLPFFQRTAWAWLQKAEAGVTISTNQDDLDKAETEAMKAFYGTGFGMAGEGTDVYIQRCYQQLESEPVFRELIELTGKLLLPLHSHLEELEAQQ